ncbi:MAG: hypothetical protein ACPHN2_04605 [Sinimarinibacterium flocculans]|uniref:hypothetical protein n=1 Tax=Sinimarinibacterium flocculans TaxID=985250 RepID=UPI003C699D8D
MLVLQLGLPGDQASAFVLEGVDLSGRRRRILELQREIGRLVDLDGDGRDLLLQLLDLGLVAGRVLPGLFEQRDRQSICAVAFADLLEHGLVDDADRQVAAAAVGAWRVVVGGLVDLPGDAGRGVQQA